MSDETDSFQEVGREGRNKLVEGTLTVPFPDSFIYSNGSAMGTSLMDVHISFAEVMPNGIVQPKVGVVLPVEHAAQLVLGLLEQITLFERTFGPIRHPEWRKFQDKAKANLDILKASAPNPESPAPKADHTNGEKP
jgi:hypothetical protein